MRYSSVSAILNKPILDFWLSLIWAFLLATHPAASPVTLMVFSHINQLIKSKFQWWINLPELMRWSASCCYQSTCCQMIVSCWNVWHYEVHLEGPAELQWLQSLKVNFRHWSPVCNLCSSGKASSWLSCMLCSPWRTEPFSPLILWEVLSSFHRVPLSEWGRHDCMFKRHFCTHGYKWLLKNGNLNENNPVQHEDYLSGCLHECNVICIWLQHDSDQFQKIQRNARDSTKWFDEIYKL